MDIQEAAKRIKEIDTTIEQLSTEKFNIRQQFAEQSCPYKLGERLTRKDGKKEAVITAIRPTWKLNGYTIYGKWVLKSGKEGEQIHQLFSFDWPHEVNEL